MTLKGIQMLIHIELCSQLDLLLIHGSIYFEHDKLH